MAISIPSVFRMIFIGAIGFGLVGAAPQKEPYSVNLYLHAQRFVDIGGRRMNIICSGNGSPTVILDAGLGADSTAWRLVHPEVEHHTRVCAYDRAGMGFSDPTTSPRDAAAVAGDLHALLRGARISPPYVLVGWSSAGLYTRLYADRYPNDVVGLVEIEPMSEYEEERIAKIEPALPRLIRNRNKQLEECAVNVSRGKCAFYPGLAGNRRQLRAFGCPQVDPQDCAVAEVAAEHMSRTPFWRDYALEAEALTKSAADVRAEQRPYGDLPLIVLTESEQGDLQENKTGNDPIPVAQQRAAWREHKYLNDKIAELSSRGTNRVIAGSQHSIPLDHPAAVVSAVNEVVDEARYNAHQ